ncbi:hypothetical protein Syun_003947 [Stephania yunnanensis]|uniref:Uncharacterized protein n=1 Tax=Stephania yunnanensis TaxID=152371 RepID=A0AAP0Q109_9MAGN
MTFNGGLNSKIPFEELKLSHDLRLSDRSVRRRATASLLTPFTLPPPMLIHRSSSLASSPAGLSPPLPGGSCRRSSSSVAHCCTASWSIAAGGHPHLRIISRCLLLAWRDSSLAGATFSKPPHTDLLTGSSLHRELPSAPPPHSRYRRLSTLLAGPP